MTTITIDTPVKLKKTHFATTRDLLKYLLSLASKHDFKMPPSHLQYDQALKDYQNTTNIISLTDYMAKRGLTK